MDSRKLKRPNHPPRAWILALATIASLAAVDPAPASNGPPRQPPEVSAVDVYRSRSEQAVARSSLDRAAPDRLRCRRQSRCASGGRGETKHKSSSRSRRLLNLARRTCVYRRQPSREARRMWMDGHRMVCGQPRKAGSAGRESSYFSGSWSALPWRCVPPGVGFPRPGRLATLRSFKLLPRPSQKAVAGRRGLHVLCDRCPRLLRRSVCRSSTWGIPTSRSRTPCLRSSSSSLIRTHSSMAPR